MEIPGIKARHVTITDECRENRGEYAAFQEAMERIFREYCETLKYWPIGKGAGFHLVLTVAAEVCRSCGGVGSDFDGLCRKCYQARG